MLLQSLPPTNGKATGRGEGSHPPGCFFQSLTITWPGPGTEEAAGARGLQASMKQENIRERPGDTDTEAWRRENSGWGGIFSEGKVLISLEVTFEQRLNDRKGVNPYRG